MHWLLKTTGGLALGLILVSGKGALAAPLVTDIHAMIYRDLSEWEAEGLCDAAFMLRPYPPSLIKQMLEQVIERGEGSDRTRAQAWMDEFGETELKVGALSDSRASLEGEKVSYRGIHGPEARIDAPVLPWLWGGGRFGVYAYLPTSGPVDPAGEDAPLDTTYGGGDLTDDGPTGSTLGLLIESAVYAGTDDLWFGAATTRSSFGPFFDNGVVIGPQAPSTVNFTGQARLRGLRFSMGLFELVRGGDVPQATSKHAILHGLSYSPSPNIDVGILEAVVQANGLDLIYLVPLGSYSLLQERSGYSRNGALGDNSLLGAYGTWRFLPGTRAKALVLVDDLQFNQIVRGTWDTKWTLAAQAGVEWAPRASQVRLVSADYTMAMPYMFTHYYARDDSSPEARADNDQNNWTTYGKNWGPSLLPNSDRLELRARIGAAERLDVDLVARVMRHGNASAGVRNADPAHDRPGDTQDGGLFDDGWFYSDEAGTEYSPSYQQPYDTGTRPSYTRFLTQDVIEVVLSGGVGVSWRSALWGGVVELSGRYLIERVRNETVAGIGPVPGRNATRHYVGTATTFGF